MCPEGEKPGRLGEPRVEKSAVDVDEPMWGRGGKAAGTTGAWRGPQWAGREGVQSQVDTAAPQLLGLVEPMKLLP